jgi:carbon monoxide dehydrogenase subunit G
MPGATLTEVNGPEFTGAVKVKVGPVSLLYKGSGEFLETDEQARRVVIKAAGKDSRGNGTAAATVTVTLTEDGGGTQGSVVTDLTITGKPAQFGRGMIVEVGGKILDTFATCLAGKLDTPSTPTESAPATAAPAAPVTAAAPAAATTPAAAPAAAAASATAAPTTAAAAPAADTDPDEAAEEPPPAKPKPATRRRTSTKAAAKAAVPAASTDGAVAAEVPAPETETAAAPRLQLVAEPEQPAEPAAPPAPRQVNAASETEAIDLLDYAGPSVAKRLIPAVLGIVAFVLLVRRLRRR